VRALGLIGNGEDPMVKVLTLPNPYEAERIMRREEQRRAREGLGGVGKPGNKSPGRVENLTGARAPPALPRASPGHPGVAITYQPRLGRVSIARPLRDEEGREVLDEQGHRVWVDYEDKVQGIVLMRKNEPTTKSLEKVHEKIKEMNQTPGKLLPGTQITLHFDLTTLLNVTTETV